MSSAAAVTVLVLTRNPGPEFPAVIAAVRGQRLDGRRELLVIDSGSTDGSVEWLRRQRDVRLLEIEPTSFNHGATRALGVREACGEIVVLLVQDALPADDGWLQQLVRCYDDPQVAGAWSRQIPRREANPFIRWRLSTGAAASLERRVQALGAGEDMGALPAVEKLRRISFDNVSASVRRSVALEIPFRPCRFGEDLDWAYRVLRAGYTIVYEPGSAVVHSHDRSMWYEFRRVYLDHQQLRRGLGLRTVPGLAAVLLGTAGATVQLLRALSSDATVSGWQRWRWRAKALPYAFTQNLAQYLGARSADRLADSPGWYRRLDERLGRGI